MRPISRWKPRSPGGFLTAGAALLALVLGFAPVSAQNTITGTVIASSSQQPLAGAQVQIDGTELGSLTDNRGRFLILNAPGGAVTVRVVMIGYQEATAEATSGEPLTIELQETAISLDEIVVTGVVGEQTARAVGNVVGQVDAAQLEQLAPSTDIQRMISASVPGVRVSLSSGEVGTGGTTRIRGIASLSLGAQPLIYVDGVRVNGDEASLAFGSTGFRSSSQPSRLGDFNPDEIENIEIIKGPAAATLYGTEASNGVINIITKRGRTGAPRINVTMKQGANFYPNVYNMFADVWYRCNGVSQTVDVDERLKCTPGTVASFNVLEIDRDVYGNEWFQTGHAQSYGADVTGGSQQITYFVSADWDRDEGVVEYNWKNRMSGRANVTYTPSDRLQMDFGLGAIRSTAQSASAQQPLPTAIIWACPAPGCEAGDMAAPSRIDGPYRGYIAYLPEAYEDEIEGFQHVDRTTFSLQVKHEPYDWFTQRAIVGGDFSGVRNSELYRATGNIGQFTPWGRKTVINLNTSYFSLDYQANGIFDWGDNLSLTTSGGVQYYQRRESSTLAHGETFPVEALETVSSGAEKRAEEDFLENKTFGVFVQEQIAWGDRFFLTGAVRGDDNSAFGKNFDFVVYPKLSASYVISDEEFFQNALGGVNTMKLRAAWGQAGKQPDVFDAIQTYTPTVGPAGASVLTPENIGNPDLKPEVGTELEVGFDVGLMGDLIGIEFTAYTQTTNDALVRVPVIPSKGFPGVQFRNIGEIRNRGVEVAVNGAVYTSDALSVDLGATFSTFDNEVTDLGGQPPIVQSSSSLNRQFHVEGFPLGSMFYKRVVNATLDGSSGRNVATNLMCEGGETIGDSNFSWGDGSVVPCAGAPEVYWGQPIPNMEAGMYANVRVGQNLSLYALVDYVGGHHMSLGDISAQHRFFINSRAILERTDPILLGYEALGAEGLAQSGVVDGSFMKLRTVSASYTLPTSMAEMMWASRVALTASLDNIFTIWQKTTESFGHPVMDIERTHMHPANFGLNGYLQEGWPQTTRFTSTLRLTF
ncbi:MAG: SusC/RagA family TonB-linked outer membrane protein [Gemmatimonadota bacterium]|nr:SusC/RagA family TonB-linked outer membrane protein [Gemmatimonadota bacterium]MDE2866601.1 SusC/RagA family TonB-linked outer membrane protein [Gemmatimonadota bacterium]